jgi:hypothetical protein
MRQSGQKVWGVLVADVIGSSSMPGLRGLLGPRLRAAGQAHREWLKLSYSVTAGDEFQAVARTASLIPNLIFDLRRRLRPLELRIGIGIGEVEGPLRPPVNQLGGEAFQRARKAIEDVKGRNARKYQTLTAFRSGKEPFDRVANLVYGLHDTLLAGTTAQQWKTIDAYLATHRVDRAARSLRVGASTASRNLRRGHFWQMAETIDIMSRMLGDSFG